MIEAGNTRASEHQRGRRSQAWAALRSRLGVRNNFTRARWPRLLLVIAVALVAAILVEREEGAMAARPARHPQTKLTQVQRPPPMPLILRFDLRP